MVFNDYDRMLSAPQKWCVQREGEGQGTRERNGEDTYWPDTGSTQVSSA